MKMTRREWLGAAAAAAVLRAKPLGMPIGCQTYPVRTDIGKDLPGTLGQLRSAGFETIELCSPHSYREFAPLGQMGAVPLKHAIESAGLKCESCHYNFRELKD